MSSNDLKMQFDSQFCRMNCQMFSWLLSSGERGGNGSREMLVGMRQASNRSRVTTSARDLFEAGLNEAACCLMLAYRPSTGTHAQRSPSCLIPPMGAGLGQEPGNVYCARCAPLGAGRQTQQAGGQRTVDGGRECFFRRFGSSQPSLSNRSTPTSVPTTQGRG
jgi:hypothetical protein